MVKISKLLMSLVLGLALNAQGFSEQMATPDVDAAEVTTTSDGECCDPETGCCPGGECCPTDKQAIGDTCPEEGCPCEVPCDDDTCGSGCPESEGSCEPQEG